LLALQAAQAIQALAMNAYIHGNVSPHNIAYQDGQGVLIDLATLRPMQKVLTSLCNTCVKCGASKICILLFLSWLQEQNMKVPSVRDV